MNYTETLDYINEKMKLGAVPGLDNIKELLTRLGHPECVVPAIHIAGTNGKGSIMAYLEQILMEDGLMVGRYISPTIFDYRERFQINKEYISEGKCADLISSVRVAADSMIRDGLPSPTAFEIETAAAFLYFQQEKCDVMLIECGMGGLLDATNVIPHALLNILASLSMDHMQFLGNTLEEIAINKLGIVHYGGRLVSYPVQGKVRNLIEEYTKNISADVTFASEYEVDVRATSIYGSKFLYKGEEYETKLGGDIQIYNAITAIEAAKALQKKGFSSLTNEMIRRGLMNTTWPGRFQIIDEKPLFVVDGAHNRDAWMHLAKNIEMNFKGKKIVFIMGVLRDKEFDKMLDYLAPHMAYAITVTTDSPRSMDGLELKNLIKSRGVSAEFAWDIKSAEERAYHMCSMINLASDKDCAIILACGSLSFIGDAIRTKSEIKK